MERLLTIFRDLMLSTWRRAIFVVPFAVLALAQAAFGQSAGPAVPVTVATVVRTNVPVIARAIGTVQAFQSVTVRARVDGTLDKVLFTEGQTVKPGDLLAQLDPRPYQAILDQALAKKAADQAMMSSAESDYVRYSELANTQVASRQKLEQSKASVLQTAANVRGDDATIAAAQLNLDFTRITAPIEGRVGLRLADPGNFIRVADSNTTVIVSITQIHPVALIFTLPQDTLPRLQAAMRRGKLPVLAYSSDDKIKLSEGEVVTMDSTIDVTTGTIKLKAQFANTDDALWPGQFVNVRVQLDDRKDVPTIPSAGVQHGPNGLYAYVVKPDSTVGVQPIELEQDDGSTAVLASGLQGGEQVVVAGQSRLTNGTKVAASPPKTAS